MLPNNKGSPINDPRGPRDPVTAHPKTERESTDSHTSISRLKLFNACASKAIRSKIASRCFSKQTACVVPLLPPQLRIYICRLKMLS